MATPVILRIALDTPLRRPFDYLAPRDLPPAALKPGIRVRVPFGGRRMIGLLVGTAERSEIPAQKLKPALELIDSEPVFDPALFGFVLWAAEYYHHPLGEVLAAALPGPIRLGAALSEIEERWQLTASGHSDALTALGKRGPRQRALVELLAAKGAVDAATLADLSPQWRDHLRALTAKGWVELIELAPAPTAPSKWLAQQGPALNTAQAAAVQRIGAELGRFGAFLLHGITGSGKTEVYLRVIEQVLAQGRQALVLVPEIALTPQLVSRFAERFDAPLAVLHSGLNDGERLSAWRRARSGTAGIVIGTRSAVFTPLARPGVIVIDEEHDASYKQQESLRYSARDLGVVRAQRLEIPVILGSATPSLETIDNARQGRYQRLGLPERPGAAQHPRVATVDMRRQAVTDGLATSTVGHIKRHLNGGGQVLVYLNRRGWAPTLFCPGCGWIAPCPHCDARMTVHLRLQLLSCHHCGSEQQLPLGCPQCGHEVKPVGQGTERVENTLGALFPDAALVRFDRDSLRRRGDLQTVLNRVTSGEARILVGTQMLTKGHHFPDVSLVVIVNADQGLFSADFRSSERLAQTIVQVAGRAGRASRPGEVLIQTEFPEHPLLKSLLESGYEGFAAAALVERAEAHWPPFSRLALLRADAVAPDAALQFLTEARTAAGPIPEEVRVLGPVPASMPRRAGRHHAQLLVESSSRMHLHRFLSSWMAALEERRSGRVRWSLDVDPQDLY